MAKEKFERPTIKRVKTGVSTKFGLKTEFEPITHIDNLAVDEYHPSHTSILGILENCKIIIKEMPSF